MNRRVLPSHLQVVQRPAAPGEFTIVTADAERPGDWLYGTDAIAAFLELPDPKLVYRIKDAGAPIGKLPGIGLSACRSALDAWRRQHVPAAADSPELASDAASA